MDGEVISNCEKYYKKLTEVHGQHPTTIQKDECFTKHFKLITTNITNSKEWKYYEALAISIYSPNLNVQKESVNLSIFQ